MLYFLLLLFGSVGSYYIVSTQKSWHGIYMRSLSWRIYVLYAIFLLLLYYRFGMTHTTILLIVLVSRAMFFFDKRFFVLFALLYALGSIATSIVGGPLLFYALSYICCAFVLYGGEYVYASMFTQKKLKNQDFLCAKLK